MRKIRLIGVSPRNGVRYDTFNTNTIINEKSKENIRKALQKKYSREFFLYTCDVDCKFRLSNTVPFNFMDSVLKHSDANRAAVSQPLLAQIGSLV